METKHPLGPLEVFQGGNLLMVRKTGLGEAKCFDKSNGFICEIRTEWSHFEGTDEDRAYAQLFAAAPDLLGACEYCHNLLCNGVGQATHAVAMLEDVLKKAEKGA